MEITKEWLSGRIKEVRNLIICFGIYIMLYMLMLYMFQSAEFDKIYDQLDTIEQQIEQYKNE